MDVPLHAMLAHLPVVLSLVLSLLAFVLWFAISTGKLGRFCWFFPVLLSLAITVLTFLSAELGDMDARIVEKKVSAQIIATHKGHAEVALYASAGITVFCFLVWVLPAWLKFLFSLVSLAGFTLQLITAYSGAQLVYKHGAAAVFVQQEKSQIINDQMNAVKKIDAATRKQNNP